MTKRTISLLLLAVMAVVLLASQSSARGQEVEAARAKIAELLKKAELLQDRGAAEKAEQLTKQARELEARLAKAARQDRPRKNKKTGGALEEILEGLQAGAASLRALGRGDEAARLGNLAENLQKQAAVGAKSRRGWGEREVALKQIKVMRIAVRGLLDAGREDSAALMERAIRAQELALERRRDDEAIQIRESAPNLGQRVELLMFAARKLRDAGKQEQAGAVANLGEQWLKRFRAQQRRGRDGQQRESRRDGAPEVSKEYKVAAQQIEVMQTALVALREGEREDSAELLERAVQARVVRLRRLKGEEAKVALEREPKRSQTVDVLGLAAKLWREFGHKEKAAAVGQLAEKLASREAPKRNRLEKSEGLRRVEQLEEQVAKLRVALDKTLGQLEALKHKLDR